MPLRRRNATIWIAVAGLTIAAVASLAFWPSPDGDLPAGDLPDDASSASRSDDPAGESPVVDAALPSIPGAAAFRLGDDVERLLPKVDTARDDWDTEVFTDAALAQLKRIAKAMSAASESAASESKPQPWPDVAAAEFRCSPLRPVDLVDVFRDASAVVRRPRAELPALPDAALPDAASASPSGSDVLSAACAAMLEPLQFVDPPRVEIKIFRVEPQAEHVATEVILHVAGHSASGACQQNAKWRCRWTRGDGASPPKLLSIAAAEFEEVLSPHATGLRLTDVTADVFAADAAFSEQLCRGTDHWRGRLESAYGVDPNGNVGLALGDVDGDGLDDVYVCQQGGLPNRLYVQQADGALREQSAAAGVDWMEVTRAALLIDLDNDGDQDLALAQGWYAMILENDGRGRFTKRVERPSDGHLYSLAAADYDNDGDLDLFFCGRNPSRERNHSEGVLGMPLPYHDANNGGPNVLWRNEGGFRFADATVESGLDANNRRYSYAAAWEDFDNDGDQDLYVANDFGRNNLYENRGGRFVDVAASAGVEDISAGMSVAWGDYDNDGRMDLYVSNMFSSAGNRIAYQRRFRDGSADGSLGDFRRHARGNTLFRAATDGRSFTDESESASVTMGRWAWGSRFADLNNDGWLDLYVANGFITTEDTGDL